jgi:hypothetical protein
VCIGRGKKKKKKKELLVTEGDVPKKESAAVCRAAQAATASGPERPMRP